MKRFFACILVLSLPLLPRAADTTLLDIVRRGDTPALKAALSNRADPNTKDDTGATALMHAALYASEADMRLLLDAGADAKAANEYRSTALMWAAGDAAKVRLLLDRGADVNARAVDRSNALLVAARLRNSDSMRLLIARGADIKAPPDIVGLLSTVYSPAGTPETRKVLADNGIVLKSASQIGLPVIPLSVLNVPLVRELLGIGADPRFELDVVTLKLPTLSLATSYGATETARLLIEKGADPNKAGSRGLTPLMLTASAPEFDPALVKLLLDHGADLNARDEAGRTALDWAELSGDTSLAKQLRAAGGKSMARPAPAPAAVATPRTPRAAVERALARLQPVGPTFYEHNKCISCHNQSLPSMAVKLARDRGVPVDRALASHPTDATLAVWKAAREKVLLGDDTAIGGFEANLGYGLLAMAEEGVAPNPVTDAMTLGLLRKQLPDGGFAIAGPGAIRPPLGGLSLHHFLSVIIRGLSVYTPPGLKAQATAGVERAVGQLRKVPVRDTQEQTLKLLGLFWAGAPSSERAAEAAKLVALQRPDGGWAQLPTMAPDAYATGQALYALHANGMAATHETYRKGVAYLLRTQLEDGTWFVRARGFGFQPYFDTGFPHGRDQFISAAATSWAAMALSYTL